VIEHSKTTIQENDIDAVVSILKSRIVNCSHVTEEFEKRFADYIGVRRAFATSSGTNALFLALKVLGIGRGDEVIIPSYVCDDVLSAVWFAGADAKLADICLDDFNIDPDDVELKISKNTKAIICPHLFGMPAQINKLLRLNLPLIEDCAHSIGAEYENKKVGSFGIISVFSFHALKMLTCGEGGMLLTSNKTICDKLHSFLFPNFDAQEYTLTFHMSNISAALGISQLSNIDSFLQKRKEIADTYARELSDLEVTLPSYKTAERCSSVFRYCIKIGSSLSLEQVFKMYADEGIIVRSPVKKALHSFKPFHDQYCSNTEYAIRHVVSLPIYPLLTEEEQKRVINVTKSIFGKRQDGRA
jgi:dTDP-4-amino-4,6-dideoxygalactose transaminase